MTVLQTPRLLLRTARPNDAEALHDILSSPEAMRFWSSLPHCSLAETRQWLAEMLSIPRDEGEDFVVERNGTVIGKAGLFRFPEIGFIFSPQHWGQGFAREAVSAIIDRAFKVHKLTEIVADVDPRNAASLGLLTSLGFTPTGYRTATFQLGDEWCDSVDLALHNSAWDLARNHRVP
ncbi:MAG: GNAT family N-acetyltransferase [Alphaproteobacteria bacterium]